MAEKDLGILVDTRLNRSQQCVLAAKKADSILGCVRSVPGRSRKGDHSPLFGAGEGTAGVLGFLVPERHGHNGISQRATKRMKYLSCEGGLTEPGLFSLAKRGI